LPVSRTPFYDGEVYKVVQFNASIDRFEYFKKRGYEFKVSVFSVAKIREDRSYKFTKVNKGQLFYIEDGNYENEQYQIITENLRKDLKLNRNTPEITLLKLNYDVSSSLYGSESLDDNSWIPATVEISFDWTGSESFVKSNKKVTDWLTNLKNQIK